MGRTQQNAPTRSLPGTIGYRQLDTMMIFVMKKHDPSQHHGDLRGTRRPIPKPRDVHPRLQGENTGPFGIV